MCPNRIYFALFFSISKKKVRFFLFLTAHWLRPNISILFPSFSIFLLGYQQSRLVCGIVFLVLTAANFCALGSRSNSVVCVLLGLKQKFLEWCHPFQTSYLRSNVSFSDAILGFKQDIVAQSWWSVGSDWRHVGLSRNGDIYMSCTGTGQKEKGSKSAVPRMPTHLEPLERWRSHSLQMRNLEMHWIANVWNIELVCIDYPWT